MIEPGDEIHYVALLDSELRTLQVVPMNTPIVVGDVVENIEVGVNLRLTLRGTAS